MQKISMDEAWKELSGNYNWSESLLEKYQDKVDWHEVSGQGRLARGIREHKHSLDYPNDPEVQESHRLG